MQNKIKWASNGSVSFYTINKINESGVIFDSMVRLANTSEITEPIILPHLQEHKPHRHHLDLIDVSGNSNFYCNDKPFHESTEYIPISTTVIPFRGDIKDKVKTVTVRLKDGENHTNLGISIDYKYQFLSVSASKPCLVEILYYDKEKENLEFKEKVNK